MFQLIEQLQTGNENPLVKEWQDNLCPLSSGSLLPSFRGSRYHNLGGYVPEEPVSMEPQLSP